MRETLIVSNRGQITLPAAIRKRTGLGVGSAVIIEERGNELVLKPAAVFEIEMYDETQIAEWDKADRINMQERSMLLKKVKNAR